MRVVINRCFGGFSLSRAAFLRLRELGNKTAIEEPDAGEKWPDGSIRSGAYESFCRQIDRRDPDLLKVLGEMGGPAVSGPCAQLAAVEIPDGVEFEIDEYDGNESIHETHRSWA